MYVQVAICTYFTVDVHYLYTVMVSKKAGQRLGRSSQWYLDLQDGPTESETIIIMLTRGGHVGVWW